MEEASSRRYYSVNANVNTTADVFRKARISRRLLILVIAATYTPDALNVRKRYDAAGSQGKQRGELLPVLLVREEREKKKRKTDRKSGIQDSERGPFQFVDAPDTRTIKTGTPNHAYCLGSFFFSSSSFHPLLVPAVLRDNVYGILAS